MDLSVDVGKISDKGIKFPYKSMDKFTAIDLHFNYAYYGPVLFMYMLGCELSYPNPWY